jgi:hypothetical protein
MTSGTSLATGSIQVDLNQAFIIEAGDKGEGVHTRQIEFNPRYLEWLGQGATPQDGPDSGRKVLRFRCLQKGETELLLEYQGPAGEQTRDIQRFRILIL